MDNTLGDLVANLVASDELSQAKHCRSQGQHEESIKHYDEVRA